MEDIEDFHGHTEKIDKERYDCFKTIQKLKLKNPKKVTIGHLNINSIRNKFSELFNMLEQNIDIMMISETKLDKSFPSRQFFLNGYKTP